MSFSMSGGAYTYNRFDLYEKKAKKDYDGDGKIESGTEEYMGSRDKAIKKAMGKQVKEDALDEKKELPDFIKKKMDEKKGKKDDDCECDDKKETKESYAGLGSLYGRPTIPKGKKEDKKKKVVKEDVLEYMLENQLANNIVSAEVLFDHISDEFLEEIEEEIMEGYKPRPVAKMQSQADKAYNKENDAVRKGDEKEVNKQMQRRIKMKRYM